MDFFVSKDSIVRTIWGTGDTILFIFAGSAAEFALNKAVDWLYFTGRLPADPIGRLFSTVSYGRKIVFSRQDDAFKAIDKITAIHSGVEAARGAQIPDWAYRDVLFMLIYYSIASYELLERKMTAAEKEEVYDVFYRMGSRMNLKDLPLSYIEWLPVRNLHLQQDLEKSKLTLHLYQQYKKHLGPVRYIILKQAQLLVVPDLVIKLLNWKNFSYLTPVVPLYKLTRLLRINWIIKNAFLPAKYKAEIKAFDTVPSYTV